MNSQITDKNNSINYNSDSFKYSPFTELFSKFIELTNKNNLINAFIVYGSAVKKEMTWRSDLNFGFIIQDNSMNQIINNVTNFFQQQLIQELSFPNRLVLYLKPNQEDVLTQIIKVNLFLIKDILEIRKFVLNPSFKLTDIHNIVIIDKNGDTTQKLTKLLPKVEKTLSFIVTEAKNQVNFFLESFEQASQNHARSDRYAYIFQLHKSFHHLMVLQSLLSNNDKEFHLPKFSFKYSTERIPLNTLEDMITRIHLLEANEIKKIYREHFLSTVKLLETKFSINLNVNNIKALLHLTHKRDYFRNFRDASIVNPKKIKPRKLYRSATLSRYKEDNEINVLLVETGIKTIIDLRMKKEIEMYPYNNYLNSVNIKYFNIPMGPRRSKNEIHFKYTTFADNERIYELIIRYLKEEIKEILKIVVEADTPILIHCHAGLDRTGVLIGLIQLILEFNNDEVLQDYQNSHSVMRKDAINIILKVIEEYGGIEKYLDDIGLSKGIIERIQTKFT
ncbi:MAG: tyrosine-protein phosphatase [Candidatus Hodarchaeales archaeon]|jgi:protein tyrosine/serine phosphatase